VIEKQRAILLFPDATGLCEILFSYWLANYAPAIIKEITIISAWVLGDASRRPNSKCYYDKRGSKALCFCFN
ncbi:MAG: hypothetical protein ACO3L5_03400, partial [Paracoccaceae bacterium]|jgi:hypothetical protein